ncbi:MAG: diacylglycerol kinase [Bacteroidales bacterium]|nr:diacylglycerol kinase [Bacteroidales bacterium]
MPRDWPILDADTTSSSSSNRRGWREKFAEAIRGVQLGVRGQASFFVHFFFTALAIAAGVILECERVEWCLVILCIGLVLTTELFNSALERLFHGLDADTKQRLTGVLDIAAGAVLMASLTAFIVGGIIFLRRLLLFADVSL